ncbi:MAG: GNAT family N-acetyltransferase [Candidatus Thermoplasmatota archaeon]|nr:GNAT family N-acetyltransferase [Candidatus Thermoplasmatota archaeon]
MSKVDSLVVVRPLRENELELMVKIWASSGLPCRPKGRDSLKALRTQRNADPELFIGAFEHGTLVGVALASDDGRKGWINRLAVVPESQGKGIARRLILESENVLRARGRRLFCVLVESYNKASMELLERAGYKKEDDIYYFTKRELKSF